MSLAAAAKEASEAGERKPLIALLDEWRQPQALLASICEKYGTTPELASSSLVVTVLPPRAIKSYIDDRWYVDEYPSFSNLPVQITMLLRFALEVNTRTARINALLLELSHLAYHVQGVTDVERALILISAFSKLTAAIRHHGNTLLGTSGRGWMCFSDFETCVGKLTPTSGDTLDEQIQPWLVDDPVPRQKQFYSEYSKAVAFLARQLSAVTPVRAPAPVSINEFVKRPELWGTPGSAYGIRDVFPHIHKRLANKWEAWAALSEHELLSLITMPHAVALKPVAKIELTKTRAVIAAPLSQYLKMAYIDQFIAPILQSTGWSPIMNSPSANLSVMTALSRFNGGFRMPLDQSHFDFHPDYYMIYTWLFTLIALAYNRAGSLTNDVITVAWALLREISYGSLTVWMHGIRVKVAHGLPSGWYWTAVLDTLINLSQLIALRNIAGITHYFTHVWAQGDDLQLTCAADGALKELVSLYRQANFEVNLKKFWISPTRDEFLRQVYTDAKVAGYPARAVMKLCYLTTPQLDSQTLSDKLGEGQHKYLFTAAQAAYFGKDLHVVGRYPAQSPTEEAEGKGERKGKEKGNNVPKNKQEKKNTRSLRCHLVNRSSDWVQENKKNTNTISDVNGEYRGHGHGTNVDRLLNMRPARLNELVSQWAVLLSRCNAISTLQPTSWLVSWFIRDVSKSVSVAPELLFRYLTTPKLLGGCGLSFALSDSFDIKRHFFGDGTLCFCTEKVLPVHDMIKSHRDSQSGLVAQLKASTPFWEKIFRVYGTSSAVCKTWIPRISGKEPLASEVAKVPISVAYMRPFLGHTYSVKRLTVAQFREVGRLYSDFELNTPEADRLSRPDMVIDHVVSKTAIPRSRVKRIIYAIRNPVTPPENPFYLSPYPHEVAGHAESLTCEIAAYSGRYDSAFRGACAVSMDLFVAHFPLNVVLCR